MASICPLLAVATMSLRCFPWLFKYVQRKGKCCLTFDLSEIHVFFAFSGLGFAPERRTIFPPR